MDTTRRSSRAARSSQPLQSTSQHSSASSNSSGRADRATRSHNKGESPRKLTPSESLSSEPPDDTVRAAVEDSIQTRQKRGRVEEQVRSVKHQHTQPEVTNGTGEVGEDDEAVRCICGFDEYPGPPQNADEDSKTGSKERSKEPLITPADVTEDLAGFFLQCDMCKVWQHGGCVGIMNEDTSPDEFFCENCRKDLHKIFTASNGQRYSHYLPLYQPLSQTTSRAASFSKDGARSPRGMKSSRPSSTLQSTAKRRSTMNSRDAAYDEAAELQRAIEASKGQKSGESTDGGTTRRGKRGRSDSEEKLDGPKRQRTASASASPTPSPTRQVHHIPSHVESENEANDRQAGIKKIRGAAARNHRDTELREERERSRVEAATKRKSRAERRVVDESEHSEELPLALMIRSSTAKSAEPTAPPLDPPPSSQPIATDTPRAPHPPPASHKKGGRPPNARKGKLGKNQYTKDRDISEHDDLSPRNRSQSRDVGKGYESINLPPSKVSSNEGKATKTKGSNSKVTMADMKRRVTAILAFISQMEYELGESMSPATGDVTETMIRGLADGLPMIKVNGGNGTSSKGYAFGDASTRDFKDLSCKEMIVELTKQLLKWQDQFA